MSSSSYLSTLIDRMPRLLQVPGSELLISFRSLTFTATLDGGELLRMACLAAGTQVAFSRCVSPWIVDRTVFEAAGLSMPIMLDLPDRTAESHRLEERSQS